MNQSKKKFREVAGVKYCTDCGNCDCPNASNDPYWRRCPATRRLQLQGKK